MPITIQWVLRSLLTLSTFQARTTYLNEQNVILVKCEKITYQCHWSTFDWNLFITMTFDSIITNKYTKILWIIFLKLIYELNSNLFSIIFLCLIFTGGTFVEPLIKKDSNRNYRGMYSDDEHRIVFLTSDGYFLYKFF